MIINRENPVRVTTIFTGLLLSILAPILCAGEHAGIATRNARIWTGDTE